MLLWSLELVIQNKSQAWYHHRKKPLVKTGDLEGEIGRGKNFGVCATKNMTVVNTILKKRVCHLATYESGPSKALVDYCLLRRH